MNLDILLERWKIILTITIILVFCICSVFAQSEYKHIYTWGGRRCSDIAKANINKTDYAIIGASEKILICDIKNPANPLVIAEYFIASGVKHVVAEKNLAYVLLDNNELRIIEFPQPEQPVEKSRLQFSNKTIAMDICNNVLCVIADDSLLVAVDVSNPSIPKQEASINIGGIVCEIAATESCAYVASSQFNENRDGNVTSILLKDAKKPQILSKIVVPGKINDIAIDGSRMYIANRDSGVHIFNILNPAEPNEIAFINIVKNPKTMYKSNNFLFVVDETPALQIINVGANSTHFKVISSTIVNSENSDDDYSIQIFDTCVFVWQQNSAVQVISIAKPDSPYLLSQVTYGIDVAAISFYKDACYAVSGTQGLVILDISNPLKPVIKEKIPYTSTSTNGRVKLKVIDTTLFYGVGGEGVFLYDISKKPFNPEFLSKIKIDTNKNISCITAHQNHLYVLGNGFDVDYLTTGKVKGGLYTYDIKDRKNPVLKSIFSTGKFAYKVVAVDSLVYVASQGLYIIDMSEPSTPKQLTYCQNSAVDVAIRGSYAYCACLRAGFQVWDISNVLEPNFKSGVYDLLEYSSRPGYTSVTLVGDSVYTYNSDKGLQLFDISNPEELREQSLQPQPIELSGVTNYKGYIYIPSGVNGLRIYKIGKYDNSEYDNNILIPTNNRGNNKRYFNSGCTSAEQYDLLGRCVSAQYVSKNLYNGIYIKADAKSTFLKRISLRRAVAF